MSYRKKLARENKPNYSLEGYASGDKLLDAFEKHIFPKLEKIPLNWSYSISEVPQEIRQPLIEKAEELSDTLFKTLVTNLCHRVPGEFYEMDHDERQYTYLDLFDSVAKKWSNLETEGHKEIFLDLVFYQIISHILTPHPTLMLHNDVVSDERRISELMHSQEFIDWQNTDFSAGHPIIEKLSSELNRLNKDIKTKFLFENLRNDQEVVRSIKFSERIYDSIPEMIDAVYRVAKERGFTITDEDFYKYFAKKKFVDVGSWESTDQDGKKNARPYFIEEKLLPTSERAIDQEYINDLIKVYTGLEKYHATLSPKEKPILHEAISNIVSKLLNEIDQDNKNFLEFFSESEEEQKRLLKEDKKRRFDEKKTPNIARQIERLEKARPRYDITDDLIKILKDGIEAKKEAIENGITENLKGFGDYKQELLAEIESLDKKFGEKLHKYHRNGKKYLVNPLKVLAVQISNFGDKALSPQVRQNSGDIEDAHIFVINNILKSGEIELPEIFQASVQAYSKRKQQDNEHKDTVDELRKYQIDRLKPSVENKKEIEEKILGLEERIRIQRDEINKTTVELDGLGGECFSYMSSEEGKPLRDKFKQFISDREKEGNDFRIKIPDPSEVAQKLGKSLEEVEAYDRQKTVAIMVNRPDRFTDYIDAENRSQFTRYAMYMGALGQVKEGNKVEIRIQALTESKERMQSGVRDVIETYDNPYVFQQLKHSTGKEIYKYGESGKKADLYAEDILAEMGFNDKEIDEHLKKKGKKRGEIKIEAEAYEMLSNSDMTKVQSSSGSIFLQADFQYDCTIEAALKGVRMVWYKGQGSGMHRSAPQEAVMRTTQGREAMMSPEGYFLRTMKSSVKYTMEKIGLKSVFASKEPDPRFTYANDDYYTFRFITRNRGEWEGLKSIFVESGNPNKPAVAESYSELYESGEFQKYYTHASAISFMKIVTYSARQTIKTSGGKTIDMYPEETDPRATRAIQFGQAVSAIIPHGGTEIFKAFVNEKGEYDVTKMKEIVHLFKENEDFKRCPALQELLCKNALMLASADLRGAWEYVGLKRSGAGSAGVISLDVSKEMVEKFGQVFSIKEGHKFRIKISEISRGSYDEIIKQSLIEKGYYKNNPEMQSQLIEDELVAIKVLARLDVDTVKSRNAMAAIFTSIREDRDITSLDFKKEHKIDSKKVILDSIPYLASHERQIANDNCAKAHSAFGYLHEFIKQGILPKAEKPKAGDERGQRIPKFVGAIQEMVYRVAYYAGVILYENNERNPTAVTRTQHAQAVEVEIEKGKGKTPYN